jgi:hypothetical protein
MKQICLAWESSLKWPIREETISQTRDQFRTWLIDKSAKPSAIQNFSAHLIFLPQVILPIVHYKMLREV